MYPCCVITFWRPAFREGSHFLRFITFFGGQGITFLRKVIPQIRGFEGSLFCALKLVAGAEEPAGKTLHIYRGPAIRSRGR